jgi:hypothetical protein
MDFLDFMRKVEKPRDFTSTGVTRETYLDIIETCVNAYNMEELERKLPENDSELVEDIHAYSRITSAIAILLANGRKQDYLPLWIRMMDACCSSAYRFHKDGIDFAVKEIMLAFKAMKNRLRDQQKKRWLELLRKVDPYKNYLFVIRDEESRKHLHNINIYNMVGEYLRETEGLTHTDGYFDEHWQSQLKIFDENGMYMDPNCPILYDVTTRCQIQIMLEYGYRGKYFEEIDSRLKKAGLYTLFMQSSSFELPYGGRSNQFLFNEALIAANCEYEAKRYKNLGDLKTAGMFKRCGHLSIKAVQRWLKEAEPPRHIKNFYPFGSKHGTEDYGYYDKYMVTLGCFIYIAFISADDSIEEYPCPAETGGYVFETSTAFHKIFANCGGNSIEIDTQADFHYDSTGLGRYHKSGFPTELALSMPFTATPNYYLPYGLLKRNASLCPGWECENGKIQYLSELSEGLEHELTVSCTDEENVAFSITYTGKAFNGCHGIKETYVLNRVGISIEAELIEPKVERIHYAVPLFVTNGRDKAGLVKEKEKIRVKLGNDAYTVSWDDSLDMEEGLLGNRNGVYKLASLRSESRKISVNLSLEHDNK